MKVVNRSEYLAFLARLDSGIEEQAKDGEVSGIIQSVDSNGEVRAQVLYFKHDAPQFMVGVRTAWVGGKKPELKRPDGTRGARSLEDAGRLDGGGADRIGG